MHINHVDFEPIYIEKHIEKARCHCISGSFGRKPRFHVIVGVKGDIVRNAVVISKTPTSWNANLALFFIFRYFIQSILNKIEMPRTHCLIFDYC